MDMEAKRLGLAKKRKVDVPPTKATDKDAPKIIWVGGYQIVMSHFHQFHHGQCGGTPEWSGVDVVRYRVHYPNCKCRNIEGIRLQEESLGDGEFDPMDNLLISVDSASNYFAVYACSETNGKAMQNDGLFCEKKLAGEILGARNESHRKTGAKKETLPFKLRCAKCLLSSHQPNGFVAITSDNLRELEGTIRSARAAKAAKVKRGMQLCQDSGHFTCALNTNSLLAFQDGASCVYSKTRLDVLKQIKMGADLPKETLEALSSHLRARDSSPKVRPNKGGLLLSLGAAKPPKEMIKKRSSPIYPTLKFGHHLSTLLQLATNAKDFKLGGYIMVIGYIDGPLDFEINIPGGKRRLGESTLEGAARELEEECSLNLDKGWLADHVPANYGGKLEASGDGRCEAVDIVHPSEENERQNAFFVMTNPALSGNVPSKE